MEFLPHRPDLDGPELSNANRIMPQVSDGSSSSQPKKVTSTKSTKPKQDDQPDPWHKKRVNWVNVALSLVTYSLVVSDVPRAGAQPRLNMRDIGMGVYSIFGSFAYGVMTFTRDPDNLKNLTATNGYSPVASVRTWSYMYDTTSSGLRTITRTMTNPTKNPALVCMNYESRCDPMGSLTLQDTFDVLDQVIDTVDGIEDAALPEILPHAMPPASSYQHTRQAGLMKRRHTDILYEYLSHGIVDSVEISSFRITHFPNIDGDFDPCANFRDRPYLCDAGPISDFRVTADPIDPDSVKIGRISKAVRKQAQATYASFHNRTNNIQVDVTFFEGFSHPMTFTGGIVVSANADFEIVKVTRVRDCSKSDTCTTIHLEDFRFEGARVITDVDDWNTVLLVLRVLGQTYFAVRVIGLFLGCYYAFAPGNRSVVRALFLAFSEVPSHVIAYGSPLPIVLYTIAMWMDGPITNLIVQYGGVRLQGTSMQNPGGIYRLICILMRRQWLMATITMVWLELQTLSNHWDRRRGSLSVRGHIFSVLSAMSMALGYHHPNFRDSRILKVTEENPDIAVLNIGVYTRDLINQKLSGVYSDLIAMFMCAIIYLVVVVVVRASLRTCRFLLKVPGSRPTTPVESVVANKDGQPNSNMHNTVGGVLFCRTEALPSTCGTMWSHLGLVCGWGGDILLSATGQDVTYTNASAKDVVRHKRAIMLINIVQLTEPVNFLLLKLGFVSIEIKTYRDLTSQAKFSMTEELERASLAVPGQGNTGTTNLVKKKLAADLPFHKLVLIY